MKFEADPRFAYVCIQKLVPFVPSGYFNNVPVGAVCPKRVKGKRAVTLRYDVLTVAPFPLVAASTGTLSDTPDAPVELSQVTKNGQEASPHAVLHCNKLLQFSGKM